MKKGAQIATILTLVIAAVFLFIVITINIGRVSQKKTVIDNACDGAALLLASSLGSVGNSLRQELELWGDDPHARDCDANWALIGGIVAIISGVVAVLTAIFTGGTSLAVYGAIAAGLLSQMVGVGIISYDAYYAAYREPGLIKEQENKFQNMTAEQRLFEGAIQYALFATVDDLALVPDLFDTDRDGQKLPDALDKIPQFNHWYLQRLNSLPRIGQLVERLYYYLFRSPPQSQFEVLENPESWDAEEVHLLVNGKRITDWLEDEFKSFIHDYLWRYGYGISFEKEDISWEEDDLDRLIKDIGNFEALGGELYNQSLDERIIGFEQWMPQLYVVNSAGSGNDVTVEDWYKRLGEWVEYINDWTVELRQRHNQVIDCANYCWGPGPWICGVGGGNCCKAHTECSAADEEGNVNCWCVCDSYCGCAGGGRGCCQRCSATHCRPTRQCNTPTGGARNCCDSGCNLYIQLCDKTTYCTGSSGPCSSQCCDTYYNCSCSNNTLIPPYIARLEEFRDSIESLRNEIEDIALEAEAQKHDPWRDKAIYVWKDTALQEAPAHMVYVKLDIPSNFKFPYVNQSREWLGFKICKGVKSTTGQFRIKVARYDEDLAKQGPLSNFWRFKFRRYPTFPKGGESPTLADVREAADRFYARLNNGESCVDSCFDELISPDKAEELGDFALYNGIGAYVTAHYGPGHTYQPTELPGQASQRNQDIYIVERHK